MIENPQFHVLLGEILESGQFDTDADAARFIGISGSHFSQILNGKRTRPTWEIGNKIIGAHADVTTYASVRDSISAAD